ncbi:MAG: hypothetical protein CMK07_13345 [Ponticaulis sp.]|nr:hypothetical protein [Ponticaulis sp.]
MSDDNRSDDTRTPPNKPDDHKKPGFDALIEDVFGLNLRGLKTIWALIRNPSDVFDAARHEHWQNRFTPSIRLYFSLIALTVFFQFIWAGPHSYMRDAFREQFILIQDLPNFGRFDVDRATDLAIDAYLLISPIIVGAFMLLTACCLFIWGKGTGFVTRIRLFFAAMVPFTVVNFFFTIATTHASPDKGILIAAIAFTTMLIVNMVTAYRGLKTVHTGSARFWKSLLYSVVVIFAFILLGTLSQIIVGIWASLQIVNQDLAMIAIEGIVRT